LIGSLLLHIVLASVLLLPLLRRRRLRPAEPRAPHDS
jgi:hypothetical protein